MKTSVALSAFMFMAIAATGMPVSAQETSRNIVLVHGAFTDETSWTPVADILSSRGFNVVAVKSPLTSLADDVDATRNVLKGLSGPTVLVGHSWGGVVIGEAGNDEQVKALVYVSAFAPDRGETLAALSAHGPGTEGVKTIHPNEHGFLFVDEQAYPTVFAEDLPHAQAEVMAKNQIPLHASAFETPAEIAAWHEYPTYYVVTGKDLMLGADAQRFFAERMGAKTLTIDAGHTGLISQAAQVAAFIETAASPVSAK